MILVCGASSHCLNCGFVVYDTLSNLFIYSLIVTVLLYIANTFEMNECDAYAVISILLVYYPMYDLTGRRHTFTVILARACNQIQGNEWSLRDSVLSYRSFF